MASEMNFTFKMKLQPLGYAKLPTVFGRKPSAYM